MFYLICFTTFSILVLINQVSGDTIFSRLARIFSGDSDAPPKDSANSTTYFPKSSLDELIIKYEELKTEVKELKEKLKKVSSSDLSINKKSVVSNSMKKELPIPIKVNSQAKQTITNKVKSSAPSVVETKLRQTNLLFIMFDDLRPELSIYGREHMITPNFERLAQRSIVFDYAYSQIAVCNPSRDSLLTGLRPDTVGTYNFQHSFRPHVSIPQQLARSGYNTAGIGKIFHWDGWDKAIWNYYEWENDWYGYQGRENNIMNSSAMPDKVRGEHMFRDHQFTERAIETLRKLVKEPKYFMLAMGFKLPHLALHVPYKYYDMYKSKNVSQHWQLSRKELKFPASTSEVSYRCCAENSFKYMKNEGASLGDRTTGLGDINFAFTSEMHDQLMMSYCAGVTFVDTQLGKLLDAVDELGLNNNLTIVLTADHGMHNGEKGIWFDFIIITMMMMMMNIIIILLLLYYCYSVIKGEVDIIRRIHQVSSPIYQ